MESADTHAAAAAPAWPTLVGIHLVVLAVIVGAWWRADAGPGIAPRTPVEQALTTMDAAATGPAVAAALADARRGSRGLGADEQAGVERFLGMSAGAADLVLADAEWAAPVAVPALPGVVAVDLDVRLVGDAYALPAFLDLLHRQAAVPGVVGLAATVSPGGSVDAHAVLRFHRPADGAAAGAADGVDARVRRTAPAAQPEVAEVMVDAQELARWRTFAAHRPALEAASETLRRQVARQLPSGLVALRGSGGQLSWSPRSGLRTEGR